MAAHVQEHLVRLAARSTTTEVCTLASNASGAYRLAEQASENHGAAFRSLAGL
jgi:hypothetical protein